MNETDKRFESKENLKEWLQGRGVGIEDEDDAADVDRLWDKKFLKPSRLLNITIEELKQHADIEGPFAREVSNKLQWGRPPLYPSFGLESRSHDFSETLGTTPARDALADLGVRDTDTPNEALITIANRVRSFEARFRYTTQDESTIGQRIEKDNTNDGKVYTIEKLHEEIEEMEITVAMMTPSPNSKSVTLEESAVNEPFAGILRTVSPTSLQVNVSAKRSNLIDAEGREQRVDISVLASEFEEWASLVTVMEGKTDLRNKTKYQIVLGQCMQRATAILKQQPWQKFVVIPFYSLSDIGFLRVDWDWTKKREDGHPKPIRSRIMPCLQVNANGDQVIIGDGFRALQYMLEDAARFGYVECPVRIDESSLSEIGMANPRPICYRSQRKALFVVESAHEDGSKCVLKIFRDRAKAEKERLNVSKLSQVSGAIQLQTDATVTVQCEWGDEGMETSHAILLLPYYCRALTPSNASIAVFGQYASTILAAEREGLCNNDISPDNLLVNVLGDGSQVGIVTDWEIATAPGAQIHKHSGKLLFCPAGEAGEDYRAVSSLGDLESLFYVAVSCAEEGVPRIYKRADRDSSDMFTKRKSVTGLGAEKGGNFKKWNNYLVGIRQALERAHDEDDKLTLEDVVYAFQP